MHDVLVKHVYKFAKETTEGGAYRGRSSLSKPPHSVFTTVSPVVAGPLLLFPSVSCIAVTFAMRSTYAALVPVNTRRLSHANPTQNFCAKNTKRMLKTIRRVGSNSKKNYVVTWNYTQQIRVFLSNSRRTKTDSAPVPRMKLTAVSLQRYLPAPNTPMPSFNSAAIFPLRPCLLSASRRL